METFVTAITTIAALLWLVGGIYVNYVIYRFTKRCDKAMSEMEGKIEQGL